MYLTRMPMSCGDSARGRWALLSIWHRVEAFSTVGSVLQEVTTKDSDCDAMRTSDSCRTPPSS